MTESPEQQAGNEGAQEDKLGGGRGPAEADTGGDPEVLPDIGGYEGRDPKSEMPRVPTVPETQEDPKSHDAAPKPKERSPGD
jgi:hypothetical protein